MKNILNIENRVENFFEEEFYPFWCNWVEVLKLVRSLCLFLLALVVNYFSVRFATENAGAVVGDLFFNIVPYFDVYNFDYFLSWGLYVLVFILVVVYPKLSPKLLTYLGSLILLRSVFVNLTFLGVPGANPLKTFFTQGGDLFFSGHVALPFMVALVYWREKVLRYFFLFASIVMSLEVLVGRQHYSIDVLAAFFITHSLYIILEKYKIGEN